MGYCTNYIVDGKQYIQQACFSDMPRVADIKEVIYFPIYSRRERFSEGAVGSSVYAYLNDKMKQYKPKYKDDDGEAKSRFVELTKEECEQYFTILQAYYPFEFEHYLDRDGMMIWKTTIKNEYKNLNSMFFIMTALRYVDEFCDFVKRFLEEGKHTYKDFLELHRVMPLGNGHTVVGYIRCAEKPEVLLIYRHISSYFNSKNTFNLHKIYGG